MGLFTELHNKDRFRYKNKETDHFSHLSIQVYYFFLNTVENKEGMDGNVMKDGTPREPSKSTGETLPKLWTRIFSGVIDLIIKNRGMIFSQMNAVGYAGVNIMSYKAGLYLPVFEIPMFNGLGVVIMTLIGILIRRPPLPSSSMESVLVTLSGMFAGLGAFCLLTAIIYVNPGDAIAIFFTVPVVCYFYGVTCCGERFSVYQMALVLLAVVGVSFVSGPTFIFENPFSGDPMHAVGLVIALLSSINYGTGYTLFNLAAEKYNSHPTMFTLGMGFFGSTFAAVAAFTLENPVFPTKPYVWIVLIACSCFSLFGSISLGFALKAESASFVSIATTTEILYTYLAQLVILGIKPTWFSGLGALMILVACIWLNLLKTDKGETESEVSDVDEPLLTRGENN